MKVSVLISTYNYAKFLPGAIESVLAQTLPADEIIVVDDGSTDDTREIVARYSDRGVRYLYKENGGISSARNAGINASKGDLLTFLDSDDRWMPGKLAAQVEHMRRYPEVGLVTASEWQIGEHGEDAWLLARGSVAAKKMLHAALTENFIGNASLTMIRRSVLDKVGLFDESVGLGQDWDMWMRIAREYPIAILPEPLIFYTRHGGSISAGKLWQRYRSNRVFHRRYISPIKSPIERVWVMRAAQSMNIYYAAVNLDDYGRRWAAAALAAVALLLDPLYKGKLKVGLLLRTTLGAGSIGRLKSLAGSGRASSRVAGRF